MSLTVSTGNKYDSSSFNPTSSSSKPIFPIGSVSSVSIGGSCTSGVNCVRRFFISICDSLCLILRSLVLIGLPLLEADAICRKEGSLSTVASLWYFAKFTKTLKIKIQTVRRTITLDYINGIKKEKQNLNKFFRKQRTQELTKYNSTFKSNLLQTF